MRFQFKTSYNQDIRLFRDKVDGFWYGLLALAVLALPLLLSEYYVGETTWVFIYAIGGVSLMVLVGYTGLVSLGHAAFLGIGAYAHAFFLQHGMPWVVVGGAGRADHHGLRPRRRPAGAAHDRHLPRHRHARLRGDHPGSVQPLGVGDRTASPACRSPSPSIFGVPFDDDRSFYYLCLFFLVLALWLTRNLLRSPTGRAWIAIRDSEIAAQSMGVNLGDLQVDRLRLLGGADGAGGRAVRAQDRLSRARHLHHPAVDPVPAAGDRGRAGLAARRGVRRDLRRPAAAGHRHPARFDPRQHGRRRAGHRHRADRRVGERSATSSRSPASRPASSA